MGDTKDGLNDARRKYVSNLAFFSVVASSPNLSTFIFRMQRYITYSKKWFFLRILTLNEIFYPK
jgi:hypothetical protein